MSSDPRQPDPEICHRCGAALPAGGPPGFCMVCFAKDLQEDETARALRETEYSGSLEAAGFSLFEVIGHGGMGVVYRARQRSPERDVAVKMLRPHLAETEEHRRRFLVEAEAMAGLHHPGILPLYAAGDADGQPWLAMKLVTGQSLAEKLSAYTGNWRGIAALMAELADALQHAHSRGVIHRDLKPANILFDEDAGRPVLTDFGLAKWPARTEEFTLQAAVMGTLAYMAPDVAEHGTRAATTATDVYGLGAVMYELLTGRPPFTGELSMASLERLITENPPAPRSLVPAIPLEVEIICLKALARSPENRYRSAELMAADLRAWLRGDPIAARPVSVTGRMVRLARRYPRTALLAVLFVCTLLVSAALLWWQNRELERSLVRARAARTDAESLVTYTTQELPARLAPAGRLDALDGVFERVAAYYSTATAREAGGEDAPAALLRRAAFLTEWTHTLHAGGRRADALARAEEACQFAAGAIRAGAEENSAAVLAAAHRRRGELLTAAGRYPEAFAALDAAAAAVREGLTRQPGDNLLTLEQADVLSDFAYTHVAAQNAAAALPYAREALQLCTALAAQPLAGFTPVQLRRVKERAMLCHYDLARTAEALRDYPLRLESDKAYLAAAETLAAADPGDATWQQALIPACNRLAETLRAAPPPVDTVRIRELDARALQTARALVLRDPANQLWQTHHTRLVAHASLQALDEKDYPAAARFAREVVSAVPATSDPSRSLLPARVRALDILADCAFESKDYAAVQSHLEAALEGTLRMLAAQPDRPSAHEQCTALLKSAQYMLLNPLSAPVMEQWMLGWLEKLYAVPATQPGAESLMAWTRGKTLTRIAASLQAMPDRADEPPFLRSEVFFLYIAALQGQLLPDTLSEDIGKAAGLLLDTAPPGFEPRSILEALAAGAVRLHAEKNPQPPWLSAWAAAAARALALLPAEERAPAAGKITAALFPEPAPRPRTEKEQKSLKELKAISQP